ncbi:MAG: ferrous iron transport protein A [Oligoflexia bacterium]|nr:ferrous iron transport protein A [Oligoflexia bacterium]
MKGITVNGQALEFIHEEQQEEQQERMIISLLYIKRGVAARITHFSGGKATIVRLHDFGLYRGRIVRLIKIAPFGGPLLVEDIEGQARLMISQKLAAQVFVEELTTQMQQMGSEYE